jgi:hypothetical protein
MLFRVRIVETVVVQVSCEDAIHEYYSDGSYEVDSIQRGIGTATPDRAGSMGGTR